MAIAADVKDMLAIKLKARHDSYSDQFTRILLMKLMILGAFFIGMNWYNDKVNCIIPGTSAFSDDFTKPACWINGLYVFEEVQHHEGDIGYYGIPRILDDDGKNKDGELCATHTKQTMQEVKGCTPMKKTFFLQYQYMVFLVAILAMLYYSPYIIFKRVNADMISLKDNMKDSSAETIYKTYFDRTINPRSRMRMRVLLTLLVKVLYIVVNVVAFIFLNEVLNGKYRNYGSEWVKWSKLGNAISFDYTGGRESPKPANQLLPSFAICEVFEEAADIKHTVMNSHKFVCELSNFILYQYIFLMMWFFQIAGILVSVVGLLARLIDHILTVFCFCRHGSSAQKMYKKITLRECEYLEFIRKKNLALYGELIGLIQPKKQPVKARAPPPPGKQNELYPMVPDTVATAPYHND